MEAARAVRPPPFPPDQVDQETEDTTMILHTVKKDKRTRVMQAATTKVVGVDKWGVQIECTGLDDKSSSPITFAMTFSANELELMHTAYVRGNPPPRQSCIVTNRSPRKLVRYSREG
jgi:hypothetical protein